jgi:hypothetical protein
MPLDHDYAHLLGRDAAAYFHTSNTQVGAITPTGSPPFTMMQYADAWLAHANIEEALNLMDVNHDMGSEFVDATTRESARTGFASQIAVLRSGQVTFDIKWIPGDGVLSDFTTTLLSCVESGLPIAMGFLCLPYDVNPGSGKSVVVDGPVGNFTVSARKSEALKDIQKGSITLGIANKIVWFKKTIAGS